MGLTSSWRRLSVDPGGSSGWHSHPGGAIIVVRQGTPTVYRAIGSQCQSTTYSAGDAFIERPGEVDDVLNAGTAPYILYVTFPRSSRRLRENRQAEPRHLPGSLTT